MKELTNLKRSIIGSGIFGILLPVYATVVLKEESTTISVLGSVLLVFAVIHYSYLSRLEKKLNTKIETR